MLHSPTTVFTSVAVVLMIRRLFHRQLKVKLVVFLKSETFMPALCISWALCSSVKHEDVEFFYCQSVSMLTLLLEMEIDR